jgi:hypothetical protein
MITENLRGISKEGLFTTASGIASSAVAIVITIQDLGMNASRAGLEKNGIIAGVAITGVGVTILIKDYIDSRQKQS